MAKEVKARKIKDLRKPGNKNPKTQKQIEVSKLIATRTMLTKNPMKNPEIARKHADARRGRIITSDNLFKKGNQYWKLRKKVKISEDQKAKLSIKNSGRKKSQEEKEKKKKQFLKDNPMKNPEIARKHVEIRKKNRRAKMIEKFRQDGKTHPNKIKNHFKEGHIPWNKGLTFEKMKGGKK